MSTQWDRCATPRCEHPRQPPAALCAVCLRQLYGYGNDDAPLITTHKSLGKYQEPKAAASPQALTRMLNDQGAVLEVMAAELALLRKAVAERPDPEVDPSLVPIQATGEVSPTPTEIEIYPENFRYLIPRRCRITWDDHGLPLRLQRVETQRHGAAFYLPGGNGGIDCETFGGRYGRPVDWMPFGMRHTVEPGLFLFVAPHYNVYAHIEIWGEPCEEYRDNLTLHDFSHRGTIYKHRYEVLR